MCIQSIIVGIKNVTIVIFLIILSMHSSLSQNTISVDTAFMSTSSTENLELQKLKEEIDRAKNIIEYQNLQLEQSNDLIGIYFAVYFGVLAMVLTMIGIIVYFQFIKPAKENEEKIKKLSEQSETILKDINGALHDVIEEHYEVLQEKKLKNALEHSLHKTDQSELGFSIIDEMHTVGFNKKQLDIILDFLQKIQYKSIETKKNITLNFLIKKLYKILTEYNKISEMNIFFKNYFASGPDGSVVVYWPIRTIYAHYLAQNMGVDDYDKVIELSTKIHPEWEKNKGKLERVMALFDWLFEIIYQRPMIAKKILNITEFVEELERLGILRDIVEKHMEDKSVSDDFDTRTNTLGETLFLDKLKYVYASLLTSQRDIKLDSQL